MKLLIFTQKIDESDDLLGFFQGWIEEFAKQCEFVTVICLYKGNNNLPTNVKVLSLGKEVSANRIKYLYRFFKYIWQEKRNYDSVFVHMNQIYVLLGGFFWKIWKKKIGLWYAHGSVNWSLRVATRISDYIFTASPESFRINNKKVKVVGHGIDVKKFINKNYETENKEFKIISIGRISPIKNYEILIKAIELLKKEKLNIKVDIIGDIGLKDQSQYLENLKTMVKEKEMGGEIKFLGSIPNKKISEYLQKADLFVHTSMTGSLDKVILEAMASSLIVLSCNDASRDLLKEYNNRLIFSANNEKELVEKIKYIINLSGDERQKVGESLRRIVEEKHNVKGLIEEILKDLML